jgi:6-phosphogluconate dehydrogenase (decarboxylating)
MQQRRKRNTDMQIGVIGLGRMGANMVLRLLRAGHRYDFDLAEVAEVWRRGSVVASWLLDLTANGLDEDPRPSAFDGRASESGEGRWSCMAAIESGAHTPVLATALPVLRP